MAKSIDVSIDFLNHSPDAHCNEYLAKQPYCFAAPQSGAVKSFLAFRHQIIIIWECASNTLLAMTNRRKL